MYFLLNAGALRIWGRVEIQATLVWGTDKEQLENLFPAQIGSPMPSEFPPGRLFPNGERLSRRHHHFNAGKSQIW